MPSTAVQQFLQHLSRHPLLQVKVQAATTADEVAMLAQELGYAVSGSDLVIPIIPTEGLMSLTLSLLGLGAMRSAEKFKGKARENMRRTQ